MIVDYSVTEARGPTNEDAQVRVRRFGVPVRRITDGDKDAQDACACSDGIAYLFGRNSGMRLSESGLSEKLKG